MNSDKSILTFLLSLESKDIKKSTKQIEEIQTHIDEIYELQKKSNSAVKDDRKKERATQSKLKQIEKRKKADKKGLLEKIFGNKSQRKAEGLKINKWLVAGLGLAALGGLAYKFRDKIGEEISDFIEEKAEDVKEAIEEKIEEVGESIKTKLGEAVKSMQIKASSKISEFTKGITDPITNMFSDMESNFYGGDAFKEAHKKNNQTLSDAGLNNQGRKDTRGKAKLTPEEEGVSEEALAERKRLDKLREEMEAELAAVTKSKKGKRKRGGGYSMHHTDEEKQELSDIKKKYENKVQKRQTGGPIIVPGIGSGDKVPMMLPAGSFVLNREASKTFDGFQGGGRVERQIQPQPKQPPTINVDVTSLAPEMPQMPTGGNMTNPMVRKKEMSKLSSIVAGGLGSGGGKESLKIPSIGGDISKKLKNLSSIMSKGFSRSHTQKNSMGAVSPGGTSNNKSISTSIDNSPFTSSGNSSSAPSVSMPTITKTRSVTPGQPSSQPVGVVKRQVGGSVGGPTQRFNEAQSSVMEEISAKTQRQVIVVKRRAPAPAAPSGGDSGSVNVSSGSELNIVEMKNKLHRLSAGAKY